MKGQRGIRLIDEFTTDLVPTTKTQTCDKCGAWTWWASPRQKKLGRCWDCVPGITFWQCTPEHEVRVTKLVLATFPGASIETYRRPRYRPDTYAGRDAGPCQGCRRRVRRYGMDAHPYCLSCRPLAEGEIEEKS